MGGLYESAKTTYEYDNATGYITILIYGIYGNVEIYATAESYVSFRLEASSLADLYAVNASNYISNNYSGSSYKNYIHKPSTVEEFTENLTFGFEFYIEICKVLIKLSIIMIFFMIYVH